MSFGFGIGDIVLCTKLAYGLYSTLTDGRANAPKDLKELGNAIFGLYCALDHLQKEYPTILDSAVTVSGSVNNAALVKQQLGYMISSCRSTLEELDTTTAKYRDAADDVQSAAVVPAQGPSITMSLPFRTRLKAQAKVQLRRVTWDIRGDSLSKYRTKLQSYTDALNLFLNSLIWSTTARIEESTAEHAQRMNQLVQEASKFSLNFAQFMQQMQAIQQPALSLPGPISNPHANFLPIDQTRELDPSSLVHIDCPPVIGGVNTVSAHFAMVEPRRPAAPISLKQIGQPSQWPLGLHIRLPQDIHVLNQSRQVIGEKEFKARQKALGVDPAMVPQAKSAQYGSVKTVQNLSRVLEGIFNTLNTSQSARRTTNEQLWHDIVDWVDRLDTLSNTLSSRSELAKDERGRTISETVKLLVTLNQLNERANLENRGIFYEASSMKIDCVFIKFKRLSTHCAKEIEEFEDEREDWKAR